MKRNFISYQETNKFSDLVVDYINQDEKLRCFINHFPTIDSFKKQIQEKTNHLIDRKNLYLLRYFYQFYLFFLL